MTITVEDEEARELIHLAEEYQSYSGDGSYAVHLADYVMQLLVEQGLVDEG